MPATLLLGLASPSSSLVGPSGTVARGHLALHHGDRLARVEALGARPRAVENGMALVLSAQLVDANR
jgi:hypothetical protein